MNSTPPFLGPQPRRAHDLSLYHATMCQISLSLSQLSSRQTVSGCERVPCLLLVSQGGLGRAASAPPCHGARHCMSLTTPSCTMCPRLPLHRHYTVISDLKNSFLFFIFRENFEDESLTSHIYKFNDTKAYRRLPTRTTNLH